MKKIIILIITAHCSLFTVHCLAQPCLPEGIIFETQSQIDRFQVNHPGCTEIEGDVLITGIFFGGGITNLNGLSVLTSIGGDLRLNNPFGLNSLTGLDGLTSIGGDLEIYHSPLTDLTGLDNLLTIGGDLQITGNDNLSSIAELDNVTYIGGGIYIVDNISLSTCAVQGICDYLVSPNGIVDIHSNATGCNNPIEVANSCGITLSCLPFGNYHFSSQAEIDNFQSDFPGCTDLEGDVFIGRWIDNDITNLNGLNVLTSIGGDLDILGNNITSLTGLDNLTSIGGGLAIGDYALTSLTGLENVITIGGDLEISGNPYLGSLAGLENVTSIGGGIHIVENPLLSSCTVQCICDYLASPNGIVDIHSNAMGCNNPIEVAANCGVTLPCLPFGNYHFYSQAEIDNFQSDFPGCTDLEGNVMISGSDITNLVGLNMVTSIGESLNIYENGSLTNLIGLEGLTSIGGNLDIGQYYGNNISLTSLTGLDNVASIGGRLFIGDLDALTSLTGLEGLNLIGGDLEITGNLNLSSLSGLENMTSIDGGLRIEYNGALTSLAALDNLTAIGGDLSIRKNDTLTSLAGLDNLASLGGDFILGSVDWFNTFWIFNGNLALDNIGSLSNLTSINGDMHIIGNPSLPNLIGLNNIASVGGDLVIFENSLINNLTLNSLDTIGRNLEIGRILNYPPYSSGNTSLTDLTGLDNLDHIGGNLYIVGNDTLNSLTGLENLNSINGEININYNSILAEILSLSNLDAGSISNLNISANDSLSSCEAQSICDYLANPGGSISIYNNASGCNNPPEVAANCGVTLPCLPFGDYYFFSQADIDNFQSDFPGCTELEGDVVISGSDITSLEGLNVVTSIGGRLSIYENGSLYNLTGLEGLSSIGGRLYIGSNISLTSLSGLEGLSSIGGRLYIGYNITLTSLTGLDNINAGSISELYIVGNNSLSTCNVESVCDYLSSPSGAFYIYNNSSGCNSPEEVELACTVTVDEISQESNLLLFPNPCSSVARLRYLIHDPSTSIGRQRLADGAALGTGSGYLMIDLYSIAGIKIGRLIDEMLMPGTHEFEFDVTALPAGVYFLRVQDNQQIVTKKLIVQ